MSILAVLLPVVNYLLTLDCMTDHLKITFHAEEIASNHIFIIITVDSKRNIFGVYEIGLYICK
jgi:hypothetical protein